MIQTMPLRPAIEARRLLPGRLELHTLDKHACGSRCHPFQALNREETVSTRTISTTLSMLWPVQLHALEMRWVIRHSFNCFSSHVPALHPSPPCREKQSCSPCQASFARHRSRAWNLRSHLAASIAKSSASGIRQRAEKRESCQSGICGTTGRSRACSVALPLDSLGRGFQDIIAGCLLGYISEASTSPNFIQLGIHVNHFPSARTVDIEAFRTIQHSPTASRNVVAIPGSQRLLPRSVESHG